MGFDHPIRATINVPADELVDATETARDAVGSTVRGEWSFDHPITADIDRVRDDE